MPSRSTLRTLARIHAWTGIVLGLPLLLIALSGVALLFKNTLLVPASWKTAPLSQAAADAEIVRLLRQPELGSAASIAVARGERAFHVVERRDGPKEYWRFGAAAPERDVPWGVQMEPTLLELHEHLLLGSSGDVVVRILGPVATVLMLVGAVLWWPLRRGWRARDLVPRAAGRPQLLRSHLALGSAAGLLFLVHAGSGSLMSNNPSIRGWLQPLTPAAATAMPANAPAGFATGDAAAALAAVRALHPVGAISYVAPKSTDAGLAWALRMRLPGENHPNGRSNVTVNLGTGAITAVRDARLAGVPGAYDDVVFPLHVGTLFAPVQRWVWLAGALGLALLVLLGAVAFLRRPRGSPA